MLLFDRVLVTGGAGFIGSHIVDSLIGIDCSVRVYDNFTTESLENLGKNISIPFDYQPAKLGYILDCSCDISLICKDLGFRPAFTLEKGLRNYSQRCFVLEALQGVPEL